MAEPAREDLIDQLQQPAVDESSGRDLPHVPLLDAAQAARADDATPSWRGWMHAVMTPVALAAGIVLISLAQGAEAKWGAAVFAVTSLVLFGNSALYHRFQWSPPVKVVLRRIDHANIFLLIAGTYTPVSLLALPPDKSLVLLSLVWSGALIGIGFRIFWMGAPRWLYVPLYLGLGWAAMMYLVDLAQANLAMIVLVLVGGLCYSVGAIAYGIKWPNPWPGRFGFHEVFHAFTVLAFLCHWVAILLIALSPPLA